MGRAKNLLLISTAVVVGLYFLFLGLVEAKVFLAPLVTATILALLVIPISRKLESWKINKMLASLLSTVLLLLFSFGIVAILSFQIKSFVDDWAQIKENMKPKIEQVESLIYEYTSVEKEQVEKYKEENNIGTVLMSGKSGEKAFSFASSVFGFVTDYILVFIYIFFLIHYRRRYKEFILRLFPDEKNKEVQKIFNKTSTIGQDYLRGKLILIFFLSILYSIGLGISGVNNFILVSVIAAFLTLIPFIGNIIGMLLAVAFGFIINGEIGVLIGILITFTIVQFVESYIFEPYVVGDKVNVHPFFVILAIILGNLLWGVIGMILAIPVFGILNVLLNNIPVLKPFGYLFSTDGKKKK